MKQGFIMTRQRIIFGIIFMFATLLNIKDTSAQQFSLYNFDTTEFPTMKVMFYARTMAGNEYNNITVNDFDLWEDGVLMNPTLSIDCQEVEYFPPVAVHFMLDASQSMGDNAGNGESRLKWVKDGVNVFLDTLHLDPPSEIASISFAGQIKNNSGFVDEDSMRKWLDVALKVEFGSTDFGPPYVQKTPFSNGALFNLATRDPNLRRVAIFMSDGEPERTFAPATVDSIIRVAKREKIQCYAIFITSNVNPDINYICQSTGGKSYQIWNKPAMLAAFREIVGDIQNRKQCKLVWTAPYGCDEPSRYRDIRAIFKRIPDSVITNYVAPTTSIANVKLSAAQLKFGKPSFGTTRQDLDLIADVADITISGFTLNPANSKYTVDWNGKTTPFTLLKGETHKIFIDYVESPPTASEETILNLIGSPCAPPPVSLIAPCGGTIEAEIDFGDVALQTSADKNYNCIYENTTPIDITGDVTLGGADATDFEIVSGAGAFTLAPGGCLDVTVRFKPTSSAGNKTADLLFNTDADCGPAKTDLKGNAVASDFPMPTLDFGKKRVMSDNSMQYEIKNTTSVSVKITNIVIQNTGDANFTLRNIPVTPVDLAPDASVFVDVDFKPQSTGVKDNYIDVTIENVTGVQSGRLTGTGTMPEISAPKVTFAGIVVGGLSTKDLVITNPSSTEDLSVYTVVMPVNPDFKFATSAVTDNFKVTMNNGTVDIPIEFSPSQAGLRSVEVTIRCDIGEGNPPYLFEEKVTIEGLGLGIDITPTSYDYQDVLTCGAKDATFVINNTAGTTDITINSINFTGMGASAFSVVPPQPNFVPAGENANLIVRFAPDTKASYVAAMNIETDNGDAMIALKGVGTMVDVKPMIAQPDEKVLPGRAFPLTYSIPVPNLNGATITSLTTKISYYGQSYVFENNPGDITTPNVTGWNWTVDTTVANEIYLYGSGPATQLPKSFDFRILFHTYLSDKSTTNIIVAPLFQGLDCVTPVNDTLELVINTCYTEGRLIIMSDVEYYMQDVTPNPAGSEFELNIGLGLEAQTKIQIYDAMGGLVKTLVNREMSKGEYELSVSTADMSNGVYFIRLESGPFARVKKLVINK